MEKAPILAVGFSVPPDKEQAFNEFYHHAFLPHLLRETPELTHVRRYEEHGVGGGLRWYNKQYITIYELASVAAIDAVDAVFARPAVADVVKTFRQWKDDHLKNFSRVTYKSTWSHARQTAQSASPWMFLWQLEMKPEFDAEFQKWYEETYLPLQVAEINWSGCNRYTSVGREPVRHFTRFEAADEHSLMRCLTDLRAPHRNGENFEWQKRVEPAVSWHDATSFRPIFRWPD